MTIRHSPPRQQLDKEILRVVRQTDKKQIIFYHDKGINFPVEKEFQQLWRNTSVDGLQDDNIEEYLNKQVSHPPNVSPSIRVYTQAQTWW